MSSRVYWGLFVCLLLFVAVAAGATEPSSPPATSVPTDDDEGELVVTIQPVADTSRRAVGPSSRSRVGPWVFGESFESDRRFFEPFDAAYEQWFLNRQREIQKQKQEEARRRQEEKKKAKGEEELAMTKESIARRTKTRRAVLTNSKQPLLTKVQTVMVDVRAFARRIQRLVSVTNRSLRDEETQYQALIRQWPNAIAEGNLTVFSDLLLLKDKNDTTATVNETLGLHLFPTVERFVQQALDLVTPVRYPFPVLLVGNSLSMAQLELQDLLTDLDKVHSDTVLAKHGILPGEEDALRQAQLKPTAAKPRLHPEGIDDFDAAEDAAREERAIAKKRNDEDAKEQKRLDALQQRHAERLVEYTSMERRLRVKGQMFLKRLQDEFFTPHAIHQQQLSYVVGAHVVTVLDVSQRLMSLVDGLMVTNDQSSKRLERQMRLLQKTKRRLEDEMMEVRTARQQLASIDRRDNLFTLKAFVKLMDLTTTVRAEGVNGYFLRFFRDQEEAHALVAPLIEKACSQAPTDIVQQLSAMIGLTATEARAILYLPILSSTLLVIGLALLHRYAIRPVILACLSRLHRHLHKHYRPVTMVAGHVEPFRLKKFAWQVVGALLRKYFSLFAVLCVVGPFVAPFLFVDWTATRYLLSAVLPRSTCLCVLVVHLLFAGVTSTFIR